MTSADLIARLHSLGYTAELSGDTVRLFYRHRYRHRVVYLSGLSAPEGDEFAEWVREEGRR